LWDQLADLIPERGFRVERGNCHGANGLTNFGDRVVRVRADVDDAQSGQSLAHEAVPSTKCPCRAPAVP
jgi:hypothetical protein